MSKIPMGNIEVMGNFSEVAILVLSKFAPVGHLILDLDRKNFDKNFAPVWDVCSYLKVAKILSKNFAPVWMYDLFLRIFEAHALM